MMGEVPPGINITTRKSARCSQRGYTSTSDLGVEVPYYIKGSDLVGYMLAGGFIALLGVIVGAVLVMSQQDKHFVGDDDE